MNGSIEVDASVEEDGRYDIVSVLVRVSLMICRCFRLGVVGWSDGVMPTGEEKGVIDGEEVLRPS